MQDLIKFWMQITVAYFKATLNFMGPLPGWRPVLYECNSLVFCWLFLILQHRSIYCSLSKYTFTGQKILPTENHFISSILQNLLKQADTAPPAKQAPAEKKAKVEQKGNKTEASKPTNAPASAPTSTPANRDMGMNAVLGRLAQRASQADLIIGQLRAQLSAVRQTAGMCLWC